MSESNQTDALAKVAERAINEAGIPKDTIAAAPLYRVMADSKIPVSKARGKLWKSRRAAGQKAMANLLSAWDEAIRYYNHDQAQNRDGADPTTSNNLHTARKLNTKFNSTENIVFSNVNAQIPSLYAKNPIIELTAASSPDPVQRDKKNKFVRQCEKLINILFNKKVSPGINLKAVAKRNVMVALLTNTAWFEVGYTKKEQSSEEALLQLQALAKQLADAKDQNEIVAVEQKIFALEERTEFLRPAGPFVRIRSPQQVIVDPEAICGGINDSNWIIIEDMLSTQYINAVYGEERAEDGKTVKSVYEATHILDGGSTDENQNFSLFDAGKTYSSYGYEDDHTFNSAKRTKVCYVWDKLTRRLEMYSEKDWSWPIWVWDDPYQLDTFFPLVLLTFHDNPTAQLSKGEVSYYLDQQDHLNEINDEARRSLLWARRNLFFNSNSTTQEVADSILSGNIDRATPLDIKQGQDPKDIIFSIPPPATNFQQLFDKRPIYAAIDRIAATNDVMRGAEFKTNTTNQAVDYYATQGNKREDERLDAVETAIAEVGWLVLQLCLSNMDVNMASKIIGEPIDPADWQPIDPLDPGTLFSSECVGGSTTKSSRAAKKQEAVQVGQVLSQYVRAAPQVVLPISLRMMEEAFDTITITAEDWEAIANAIPEGGPEGDPGRQPQTPGQAAPLPNAASGDPAQMAQMVAQTLEQLPPQVLQAIGTALAQGARPTDILQQVIGQLQQGAN